jgi:hypothetical protein
MRGLLVVDTGADPDAPASVGVIRPRKLPKWQPPDVFALAAAVLQGRWSDR